MPKHIMAIDPGCEKSAYTMWDGETIIAFGKNPNAELREMILEGTFYTLDRVAIEQVRSYGMPVGAEVFDTVFWSGIFAEAFQCYPVGYEMVPRRDVKMHLCGHPGAKDSNIIQALRDRYAYGVKNYGKGTKSAPGFFYGFKADIWQAFALAVTFWDKKNRIEGVA